MNQCTNCPLRGTDTVCPAMRPPFHPYCERVDPASAVFHPGFPDLVRRRAAEADPSYVPPAQEEPPRPPSLVTQAANFAKAVATHVAAGLPQLDDGPWEARMAICRACPQFLPGDRCGKCGCGLTVKARWADSACPEGKWPETITPV